MSAKGKRGKQSHDGLFLALQMVLGVIVGVLFGAGWLALKPVKILDAPPAKAEEKADRHEVTYIRGRPPGRGAPGARKQKAFLDRIPGEIVFAEEDINRWLAGVYASKERTIEVDGFDLTLGPRVPSVRFVDDEMEIGLEIGMDRAGGSRTIVAQARGRFAAIGGKPVFVPQQIHLGSCPLPWNLGGRFVYERLLGLYPVSENVTGAWAAVESAEVAKGRLRVVLAGAARPGAPAPLGNDTADETEAAAELTVVPVVPLDPAPAATPPASTTTPIDAPAPGGTPPTEPVATPPAVTDLPLPPLQQTKAVLDDVAEKVDEANAVIDDAAKTPAP